MRGLRIRCDPSDRTRRPPGCVRLPACTIARSSLAPVSVPMFLTGLDGGTFGWSVSQRYTDPGRAPGGRPGRGAHRRASAAAMTVHGVDPLADPSGAGCVECEAGQGTGWWYHLCRCAQCGHIGCCDSSPLQHAFGHAITSGHPVICSFEPGESWFGDYQREVWTEGPALAPPDHHPLDQPTPGPAGRCPRTGSGVLAVLTRLEMLTRIDAYRDDEVSRAFLEPAYALDVPSVSCLPPSRRPAPTWSPTPASDAKPGPTGTFG